MVCLSLESSSIGRFDPGGGEIKYLNSKFYLGALERG